jgi:hypothetical protein
MGAMFHERRYSRLKRGSASLVDPFDQSVISHELGFAIGLRYIHNQAGWQVGRKLPIGARLDAGLDYLQLADIKERPGGKWIYYSSPWGPGGCCHRVWFPEVDERDS